MVGLSPALVPAAMAADNLAMAAYLAILMIVPAADNKAARPPAPRAAAEPAVTAGSRAPRRAAAATSTALAQAATAALPSLKPLALTLMAAMAMTLSSALRALLRPNSGTAQLAPPPEEPRQQGAIHVEEAHSPFAGQSAC